MDIELLSLAKNGLALIGGAATLKMGVSHVFNRASDLSQMQKSYKQAISEVNHFDRINGAGVAKNKTLQQIQNGDIDWEGLISPAKMKEAGVENIVVLTPHNVLIRHIDLDASDNEIKAPIRYDLSTFGRFSHAAWTRQFLDDIPKMMAETYREIDIKRMKDEQNVRGIEKKAQKVEKAYRSLSQTSGGLKAKIVNIFGQESVGKTIQGIDNAMHYGVAVLLNAPEKDIRIAVDEGYMIFKAPDKNGQSTIYALATTDAEQNWKQEFCDQTAHYWTGKEVLQGLVQVNQDEVAKRGYQKYITQELRYV